MFTRNKDNFKFYKTDGAESKSLLEKERRRDHVKQVELTHDERFRECPLGQYIKLTNTYNEQTIFAQREEYTNFEHIHFGILKRCAEGNVKLK